MTVEISVENIKCGGCANSIRSNLKSVTGSRVTVDIDSGIVNIDAEGLDRTAIVDKLARLGYPESGSVAGLDRAAAKAKSFVSCAIGRIKDDVSQD